MSLPKYIVLEWKDGIDKGFRFFTKYVDGSYDKDLYKLAGTANSIEEAHSICYKVKSKKEAIQHSLKKMLIRKDFS